MRKEITTQVCNQLWLLCFRAWLYTSCAWCIMVAKHLSPHVTYFPDHWYTQKVDLLDTFGLTKQQIKDIWEINGTWSDPYPKVKDKS